VERQLHKFDELFCGQFIHTYSALVTLLRSGYSPKGQVKNCHKLVIFRKHIHPLICSGIHNTNPTNRHFTL